MKKDFPLIEVKGLYFRYPHGDYVLKNVSLVINRGEHVLVIGDTGSGKTTLARAIMNTGKVIYEGEIRGTIRINGINIEELSTEDLTRLIHLIGQNPYAFFTEPIVYEDLYNYALRVYRKHEVAEKSLQKVIEATGIYKLLNKYFYELSGGEARRVLITKALVSNPQLLIFDEPLMWLDERGVNDFLDLLRLLRSMGKSVLIFEHRFIPLIRNSDKLYFLKNGSLHDITDHAWRLIKHTTEEEVEVEKHDRMLGEIVLEAKDLHFRYGENSILKGINITVRERDLILVHGENGSGKTTLLKIISGYLKPQHGSIKLRGRVIYIPQNILLFFTEDTVEHEIKEICRVRRLSDVNVCIKNGLQRVKDFGIDPDQPPINLSHGQMVKLAIILGQIANTRLLLLDEPFSGLTYSDRLMLLKHLESLGLTAIVTTSTLEAISASTWSRAYRIDKGRLVELSPLKIKRQHYCSLPYATWVYEELKRVTGN